MAAVGQIDRQADRRTKGQIGRQTDKEKTENRRTNRHSKERQKKDRQQKIWTNRLT